MAWRIPYGKPWTAELTAIFFLCLKISQDREPDIAPAEPDGAEPLFFLLCLQISQDREPDIGPAEPDWAEPLFFFLCLQIGQDREPDIAPAEPDWAKPGLQRAGGCAGGHRPPRLAPAAKPRRQLANQPSAGSLRQKVFLFLNIFRWERCPYPTFELIIRKTDSLFMFDSGQISLWCSAVKYRHSEKPEKSWFGATVYAVRTCCFAVFKIASRSNFWPGAIFGISQIWRSYPERVGTWTK